MSTIKRLTRPFTQSLTLFSFVMIIGMAIFLTWSTSFSAPAGEYTIRGVVLSSNGKSIAQARVKISETSESTKTDSTGRFRLTTRSSGTVNLITTAKGHRTDKRRVKLTQRFVNVVITLKLKSKPQRLSPKFAADAVPGNINFSVGVFSIFYVVD